MKQLKSALALGLAIAVLAPLSGCGGKKKPEGLPSLEPTTLTFTVDGKGLANANISLQPVDNKSNKWVPSGKTDASGKVELQTGGPFKGAPVGEYKVVVSADEEIDYGEDGPPPSRDDAQAYEDWSRKSDPNKWKRYSPVDAKYTNMADTPLSITIQAGKNAQEFDLGASTKAEVKQDKK